MRKTYICMDCKFEGDPDIQYIPRARPLSPPWAVAHCPKCYKLPSRQGRDMSALTVDDNGHRHIKAGGTHDDDERFAGNRPLFLRRNFAALAESGR